MFFALALSTVALTGAAAMQKIDADLKRTRTVQHQSLNQLNSAVQQLQTSLPTVAPPAVTISNPPVGPAATVAPIATSPSLDSHKRREAVRQAEMQRDRINAKEQRIDQLQKSIEWNEEHIRRIRHAGGNERIFVEQRDQLVKQKWELQR